MSAGAKAARPVQSKLNPAPKSDWKQKEEKLQREREANFARMERERREKREKESSGGAKAATHPDSIIGGGIGAATAMWNQKTNEELHQLKTNTFSANYDEEYANANKLKPGDEGYGQAPEGSQSAERVAKAELWVKKQVKMMIDVIEEIGVAGPKGFKQTNFAELFVAYEKISDTCMGILSRAKKAGYLMFEGEMLFQGVSDNVVITLTSTAASYNPDK